MPRPDLRLVGFRAIVLFAVALLAPRPNASPPARFLTPPYLQNVRTNGITLMWELSAPAAVEVEYGPVAGSFRKQSTPATASGAATFVGRCVLSGLQPGSSYTYRTWLQGQEGPAGSFRTAPAGPADFLFGVWSDSQGSNHDAYPADPLEPTKSMMRHMAAAGLDLAVAVGDLAENGTAYADTRQYYLDRVARLLGPSVPWFVAWGNHDGGPEAIIRRFADLPSKDGPTHSPGYGHYSFDYAGCHFICLDLSAGWLEATEWVALDLQSDANRNARFTFLFVHVPPFCELWIDGDSYLRETLVPLMEAYGVDACFSGHTHEYSRGFLNGVHYCITGGGSWLDTPEVLVWDWDHMTVGGHHSIPGVHRPDADRGGGLINEYVRVDVRADAFTASMVAFAPDGTPVGVLDTFSKSSPTTHPPATPLITGPATVDVGATETLTLRSSPFHDPDPGDTHQGSLWRLTSSPAPNAGEILFETTTGPGVLECVVPLAGVWPGRTLHATVRHGAGDGRVSAFAAPIAIRIQPGSIVVEDFETTPEFLLPKGWTATHATTIDSDRWDPDDPRSNFYLTWTVVTPIRLANAMGANRVNAPSVVAGKSVYTESDHRRGAQRQFLFTPEFNLRGWTNVLLMFRSNYLQNQDNLAALEFTTDGGAHWNPVVCLLDRADLVRSPATGATDPVATLTRVDPDGVPTLAGSLTGGTYGEHLLSRPLELFDGLISGRLNDDPLESKRIERFRLPGAAGQPRVKFRFAFVGTASWFWGIDDFGLYGDPSPDTPLAIVGTTVHRDGLEVRWTGPDGPYQFQYRSHLAGGTWIDHGPALGATERSAVLAPAGPAAFYRLRLAR